MLDAEAKVLVEKAKQLLDESENAKLPEVEWNKEVEETARHISKEITRGISAQFGYLQSKKTKRIVRIQQAETLRKLGEALIRISRQWPI